jgi:hypothetical protein
MTERRLSLLFVVIGVLVLTAAIAFDIADAVSGAGDIVLRGATR